MSADDTEQQSEKLVQLHTQIDKPGVILEIRPEGQDFPAERDMSDLSRSEARDLYDQLGSYLGENCGTCEDCGGRLDDDGLCPHCFDYDDVGERKEPGDLSPEEAAFGHVRRSRDTEGDS